MVCYSSTCYILKYSGYGSNNEWKWNEITCFLQKQTNSLSESVISVGSYTQYTTMTDRMRESLSSAG